MKNKKERFIYVLWIAITIFVFGLIAFLGHFSAVQKFFNRIEATTFDIRQNIVSKYKTHNDDIVIIEIDDASYEYIMDKHTWPLSRGVWADVTKSIEEVKPKYIIFDLLFLKPNLSDISGDKKLIEQAKKFDNNYSDEIRKSPVFDDKFKAKIKDTSKITTSFYSYTNSRSAMQGLLEATNKIGVINILRDEDGIIRNEIPLIGYKDELYPNLTVLVALDILKNNEIEIKDENIILDKDHVIPINNVGSAVLNWYGKSKTFKHIAFWEVLKAIKENNKGFLDDNFKDKIIYIGTTATSLSDIKSTPVDYDFAGVEIHATFLNNILDNDFIKKAPPAIDFIISVLLCVIVGFAVLKIQNIGKTLIFLLVTAGIYIIANIALMYKLNLWLSVVLPLITIVLTFIGIYLEKYFLVTRNYELTYKLAVTDGLTQLYNHRYFQEQMILAVNNFHRYGNKFSLILIDIDFFKKFNDTYGHQPGDCVLKQVANILKKNSRTTDVACRYGGEEMSIILLNTSKDEAIITANKICTAVHDNKFTLVNGEEVNVTISIGVATAGTDGLKVQELIEYADKCLYKAKENGRNQIRYTI